MGSFIGAIHNKRPVVDQLKTFSADGNSLEKLILYNFIYLSRMTNNIGAKDTDIVLKGSFKKSTNLCVQILLTQKMSAIVGETDV